MTDCIVDTAVALKWVVLESDSPKAWDYYDECQRDGIGLLILDLAMIEAANGIWKRVHRKQMFLTEAMSCYAFLDQLPLEQMESIDLTGRALEIACDYDIAVYDAHFVAAVEAMNCDGITADEPLVAKVGKDFPTIKLLKNWQPSP